jgi:hypothetical protein
MRVTDFAYRVAKRLRLIEPVRPVDIAQFAGDPGDVDAAEKLSSDLHRLFYWNEGALVHKWRHYLAIYDRHLSRYRNTPVKILEIGVSQGGSLRLWRHYFGPGAAIYGIDIDPRCARFDGRDANVRIGSQEDGGFLETVVSEMGGIDVVIDDGSHVADHQVKSFELLFPQISQTGVYICEDLHTSYWPGTYNGGYRKSGTFMEYAKSLIDDLHADFHDHPPKLGDVHRWIDGIHFYNSMVVIEKKPQPKPSHIRVGTASF